MARSGLILGGADCVWHDMDEAKRLGSFDAVIAINDALAHYPGEVEIFATLHPEKAVHWFRTRDEKGYPRPRLTAAHKGNTQEGRANAFPVDYVTDYRWPGMPGSGSSGLFAVKVALEHGFDRLVLCGVPMQAERAHFFGARPWEDVTDFTEAWEFVAPWLCKNVRSMSGWTADLVGRPTPEWLGLD